MFWPTKKLGEVCEVIAGQSPEGRFYNKSGNGPPFYQGKKEFTNKFIGLPTVWTTKITKEAKAGDILMSVRAPVGPVNFATERICIGRGLAAIRTKGEIDKNFLFHFLKSIESEIRGNTGVVFGSINKSQIENIKILVPPLAEQKRIVEKIEKLFAKIDTASRLRAESSAASAALLPSALHKVFTNIKNIPEPEISEIAELGRGRVISKKYIHSHPGPYPVYSSQTKNSGEFGKINSYDFEGEYVTWTTDGANAGQVFYRNGKFNCTNVCGTIKIKDAKVILPKYLAIVLNTRTKRHVSIASGNPKLMNNVMAKVRIPVPPIAEQKKIVAYLDSLSARTRELQNLQTQTAADFSKLKQSILSKAFTGK